MNWVRHPMPLGSGGWAGEEETACGTSAVSGTCSPSLVGGREKRQGRDPTAHCLQAWQGRPGASKPAWNRWFHGHQEGPTDLENLGT